jgi:hypothetical protein
MLKHVIFILFLFSYLLCQAQNDSINNLPESRFNLKLSSNSSLIYPGISAGIEFPVHQVRNQVWIVKSPSRSFYRRRYISGNISWYHHPEFHDNLYLTAEWIMRRTRSGGFTSEFSAGPGYSRTFLGGTTYKVSDNGAVTIIKNAGYSYALITLGGGFGYDFSMKKRIPVSVFSKMNLISMFPYNSTLYFRPVLELGVRYSPSHNY